jgi:hypothetical protein
MPNHVTNRLTITGTKEQVDAFEAAFITPEPSDTEPCAWTFNHFTPMPPILRRVVETSGPVQVYEEVAGGPFGQRLATAEEIAEITATGYSGWYTWSVANWGTKWDAYSKSWERVSDTEALLIFDTAWSTPDPVFAAMAVHNIIAPLHITIDAFDEGWNFAIEGEIQDGAYEGENVEADAAMYERVYGCPPEGGDEDE